MAPPITPTLHPIIPKLELHKLQDAELLEYAEDKVQKINATNPPGVPGPFASVNPSTAQVQSKLNEYAQALVSADDGTVADTELKNQRRAELEALLTLQANDCALIANGNLALYLETGYEAKDTQGHPQGELPAVTGLELFYGDSDGELKASWDAMEEAENFLVWAFADVNNPDSSMLKEYIIGKIGKQKTVLSGLPSSQKVFVRVRANGGSTGHGAWSDLAEKRVP